MGNYAAVLFGLGLGAPFADICLSRMKVFSLIDHKNQ